MAEAFAGELKPGLKRCVVCAEPINVSAKKCIHCQSEQGELRRRIGVSSTVLSLLVALISVLTALIPVLTAALTSNNSDLSIVFHSANLYNISFFIANGGTRPGTIDNVQLNLQDKDGMKNVTLQLLNNPFQGIVMGKDSSSLFSFFSDEKIFHPPWSECVFKIFMTDFHGAIDHKDIKIDCENIRPFLQIHSTQK